MDDREKQERIQTVKAFMAKYNLKDIDIARISGTSRGEIGRKRRGERSFSKTFMTCIGYAGKLKELTGEFEV